MGASQSQHVPVEESYFPEHALEEAMVADLLDEEEEGGTIEQHRLGPGSGRMTKTFQIVIHNNNHQRRHNNNETKNKPSGAASAASSSSMVGAGGAVESTGVVKAGWILERSSSTTESSSSWLQGQNEELRRIQNLVTARQQQPHMAAAFSYWKVGPPRPLLSARTAAAAANIHWPTSTPAAESGTTGAATARNTNIAPTTAVANQPSSTTTTASATSTTTTNTTATTTPSSTTAAAAATTTTAVMAPSSTNLQARPVYLLRPYVYTTLSDRLASRPWLEQCEKLWIVSQLLEALTKLHKHGICHGFCVSENVGLTSFNFVLLLDVASYKPLTQLPDNDPSEYLRYFASTSSSSSTSKQQQQESSAAASAGTNASTSNETTTSQKQPPLPHRRHHHDEKRCYLAPERFCLTGNTTTTPSSNATGSSSSASITAATKTTTTAHTTSSGSQSSSPPSNKLTPAMDIFTVACVFVELFLNGERCLDLGDLMEYRHLGTPTPTILQKLNKIESSSIRACCKHMLQIDPQARLSAAEYYERLSDQFPPSFRILNAIATAFVQGVYHCHDLENSSTIATISKNAAEDTATAATSSRSIRLTTPDARIALLAKEYDRVLWETMGVHDPAGQAYFDKVLGPALVAHWNTAATTAQQLGQQNQKEAGGDKGAIDKVNGEEKKTDEESAGVKSNERLFAQVEALLKDLDGMHLEAPAKPTTTIPTETASSAVEEQEERSALCKSTLLIFLQFILSTIRHCQRPESKLVALQLIRRLIKHASDEARLQRVVPVTVSLLQDQDSMVRASAIQLLTSALAAVESFPPSDSKIFPQYVFKRVAHMITDPALVVRLAFTRCIASLAETSHRFLDISHAVRLYEAVGNGVSGTASRDETAEVRDNAVFGDEVTRLLDENSRSSSRVSIATEQTDTSGADTSSMKSEGTSLGKTLITSTYNADLAALHETVSRWVVHVATDQSEHASLAKRAILSDSERLCAFFGMEGVMSFILPQILAFLNDRKDWELRAALFQHMPAVCQSIGLAATEEFVLPCVEIGLVDSEERVIACSLSCLSRIAAMGLLSRSVLLGNNASRSFKSGALLKMYGPLLLHPSEDIRFHAMEAFSAICRKVGQPDCDVFVVPLLQPFFRFRPLSSFLTNTASMSRCTKHPWTRDWWNKALDEALLRERSSLWSSGAWTSIGVKDNEDHDETARRQEGPSTAAAQSEHEKVPEEQKTLEYVRMLVKHTTQSSGQDRSSAEKNGLHGGIEGSLKLAQNIMFPRQNGRYKKAILPEWYSTLRDKTKVNRTGLTEASSIRSLSALGHVYGLSIMGSAEGTADEIVGAVDDTESIESPDKNAMQTSDLANIEAAYAGEWGSETLLNPDIVDTGLLVTKMKALGVPPLPVKLGNPMPLAQSFKEGSTQSDRKPQVKNLVATSSTISGHTAPVMRLAASIDQRFFVSGSHDGTCRVWELPKVEDSGGMLESSVTYSEHSAEQQVRINDIAMLEGTHSIVSGDSTGAIHVWRVDMMPAPSSVSTQNEYRGSPKQARVVGCSSVRKIDAREGEILAVSHFNSSSASVVTFATQRGVIHSWDLRSATEPFSLRHSPDIGHFTSMALGSDRHWIVSGTSRGYVALWDIRFQQSVRLWRHNQRLPVSRLATTMVSPPQTWGTPSPANAGAMPFIFAACGSNECAMFDALSGSCRECFRAVDGDSRNLNSHVDEPPSLTDIPISSGCLRGLVKPASKQNIPTKTFSPVSTINCMIGSIGASQSSYLITGGSDCRIRFWDFSTPTKCYVVGGHAKMQPRPTFERIDFEGQRRLMLCRQSHSHGPRTIFHGLKKAEQLHTDSITDIRVIDNSTIVSCSRDCTVKIWR